MTLKYLELFALILLTTLASSCAIPISDPFEITFTERDHISNKKPDDLRFTGKSDLEIRTDFKGHELSRLIYRRKPDRDFEDLRNVEPFANNEHLGDSWLSSNSPKLGGNSTEKKDAAPIAPPQASTKDNAQPPIDAAEEDTGDGDSPDEQ